MKKKIILQVSLLLLAVAGTLIGIFWDPIIDWLPIDQSGWDVLDNGGQCYLDEDGDPITGWQELEGNTYYFDPDSFAMQIRWITLEDGRYYLGEDGIRRTDWQTIDGKRYYLGDNGAMVTGWLEQEAGMMYLNDQGNPHTGWLELPEGKYYLDENSMISITVIDDRDNHAEKMLSKVVCRAYSVAEKENVQYYQIDHQTQKAAEAAGLCVPRYLAWQYLRKSDPGMTAEDVRELPKEEIHRIVQYDTLEDPCGYGKGD